MENLLQSNTADSCRATTGDLLMLLLTCNFRRTIGTTVHLLNLKISDMKISVVADVC